MAVNTRDVSYTCFS